MKRQSCFERRSGSSYVAVLAVIVICLFTSISAFAQLPTGTVLGSVKDSSGAVVAGATVTVRNVDTGQTRTSSTETDGSYRFPSLPPGNYELEISHAGFETVKQGGLNLTVGQEAVENITLTVGATTQTVEVTTEVPLINTTSGTLGALVNQERVADLPLNGRNYTELNMMQLGVTRQLVNVDTQGGATAVVYSSNGAPTGSNNYLLDGAMTLTIEGTSPSSAAETALGVDGIKEFRMVTNASTAEYGMTMGSAVTIVSKGGTNQFHGDAFDFLRNSAMDAANFFDPTPINFPGKRIAPLRRNQFGGSFGGPIKKDKTFFFATYEQISEFQGEPVVQNDFSTTCFDPTTHKLLAIKNPCANATLVGAPPSGTVAASVVPFLQLYPYPNLQPNNLYAYVFPATIAEHYGQIRIDHNLSSADSFFGRYTIDNTLTNHPTGWQPDFDNDTSRSQFLTLAETHIFSPTLLNDARFSFSRTILADQSESPGFSSCAFTGSSCISSNSIPGTSFVCSPLYGAVSGNPPTGPGCIEMGSLGITGISTFAADSEAPDRKPQTIFTVSDDVFYTKGKHALKFGTLINHYQVDTIGHFQQIGSVTFLSPANFFAGLLNTITFVDPAHSSLSRYWRYNTFGFYTQDDIRMSNKLTVNLGLRYEFNSVPSEATGHSAAFLHFATDTPTSAVFGPPFRQDSLHNFGPRVGFAYDIFGDGKTSVRGGFALLYDIANIGRALNQSSIGQPPFDQSAATTAPSKTNQIPFVLPLTVPANYPVTGKIIDYYVKQPHMLQYNLSIERQLPGRIALTVAYAGSRGIHLWQVDDINPKAPEPGSLTTWPVAGNSLFTLSHMNPNFNSMIDINTNGDSHYNSLQVGVIKQLSHRLQFQSSYTYSKSLDDDQGQEGQDLIGPSQLERRLDYGPSTFDTRQNWRFNVIYGLADYKQGTIVGKIIDGWFLSAIESLQTGYPFSATMNTSTSGATVNNGGGNIDRPNLTGFTGNLYPHTILEWFNPAAFTAPPNATSPTGPVGVLGNEGRGYLIGPGLSNLDFSIRKDTPVRTLGEAGSVEFRAEAFNIANHPNFANPAFNAAYNGSSSAGSAGQITSTQGGTDSRRIQLALKIIF